MTLLQGLFQEGRCVATAETVIVQIDSSTRRSSALGQAAVDTLRRLAI
jgi:acyl-CoA thioester hydrolase